jgi:atrophin-1 interacting protein 3 (BAI1-associated protein 1)
VLLRVNDETVLGRPHHEVVKMFAHVSPGQTAALQLLRGYPLPAEAENDPDELPMEAIAISYNHRKWFDLNWSSVFQYFNRFYFV